MENIFKHTSRSYFDVYNALVQAYPTAPTWLFKEMSGLFDFQSELMNRIATDILYPKTRESAYAFAARCDYSPAEASPSTGTLTVTLSSAIAKTISAGYQFGGISSSTGNLILFEVDADASSGGTDTITCNVTQKKTYTNIDVGIIDNQDDYMDYPLVGYENVIEDSVSLTINSLTWTKVSNFDNSISTDRHFRLVYQSSGKVRIQFGDGTVGLKPPLNASIYASFATTEGIFGRMGAGEITSNIDGDPQISSVTNAAATSGGANPESISSIIRNARGNARLRNMVWSKEDLEIAASLASTSVVKALGIPGTGTASIQIVPSGGGLPGAPLKTSVDTYVTALTQFGSMPITVIDPVYVAQAITASTTIRTGFVGATVINLVEFAMTMTTCAFDSQVLEYFDDYGTDACRTDVINILWAWAFTSDENDAIEAIINTWKQLLGTRSHRDWGQTLEVGDLWIMGNALYDYGVDVFNLTLPVANVTVSSTQIINTGALTIT